VREITIITERDLRRRRRGGVTAASKMMTTIMTSASYSYQPIIPVHPSSHLSLPVSITTPTTTTSTATITTTRTTTTTTTTHLSRQEKPCRVQSILLHEFKWVNHIAQTLTNLEEGGGRRKVGGGGGGEG